MTDSPRPFRILIVDDMVAATFSGDNQKVAGDDIQTATEFVHAISKLGESRASPVEVYLTGSLEFRRQPANGEKHHLWLNGRLDQCNGMFVNDAEVINFVSTLDVVVLDLKGVGGIRQCLKEPSGETDEQALRRLKEQDLDGGVFYLSHRLGHLRSCRAVVVFSVFDDGGTSGDGLNQVVAAEIDPWCKDLESDFVLSQRPDLDDVDGEAGPWTFKCNTADSTSLHGAFQRIQSLYEAYTDGFVNLGGLGAIEFAALRDAPVLIVGESGTGKEGIARRIDQRWKAEQRRKDLDTYVGEWQAVNCAGLYEELARTEIFGHVRGAYTGADSHRPGLILNAIGVKGQSAPGASQFANRLTGSWSTLTQILNNIESLVKKNLVDESGEFKKAAKRILLDAFGISGTKKSIEQLLKSGGHRDLLGSSAKELSSVVSSDDAKSTLRVASRLLDQIIPAIEIIAKGESDDLSYVGNKTLELNKILKSGDVLEEITQEVERLSDGLSGLQRRSANQARDGQNEFRTMLLATELFEAVGTWDLKIRHPDRMKATLFLDEFGDLPNKVQAMLLRFLQEWEIAPLGYEGQVRGLKLRIITATSDPWVARLAGVDLSGSDERAGRSASVLRQDLVFRIMGQVIRAPSITQKNAELEIQLLVSRLGLSFIGDEARDELVRLVRERIEATRAPPADGGRIMGYVFGQYREIQMFLHRLKDYVQTAGDRGVREPITDAKGHVRAHVVRRLWGPSYIGTDDGAGPLGFEDFRTRLEISESDDEGALLALLLTNLENEVPIDQALLFMQGENPGEGIQSPSAPVHEEVAKIWRKKLSNQAKRNLRGTMSRLRQKLRNRSEESGIKLIQRGFKAYRTHK